MTQQAFSDIAGLELSEHCLKTLGSNGITEPTGIQKAAFGPILAGEHVVIDSGTGTGKTLAYLLPLLQRLRLEPKSRAVVLAPAAELAMQITRTATEYGGDEVKVGSLVATSSHRQQKARVQKSTRLIVGTPGRVLEMYSQRKLKGVNIMVLDELDRILTSKDAGYLAEVMSRPDPKLQAIVAAATFSKRAEEWLRKTLRQEWSQVTADDDPLHSKIAHHFVMVSEREGRDVRLARFIETNRIKRAIVFVNDPMVIRHLYRYLTEHGLKPVSISQERNKQERKEAVARFASGDARILITTDAGARGIDVPEVAWVVNYDLPPSPDAYVHRAGRTGRAGLTGASVVLIGNRDRPALKRLAKQLSVKFSAHGKQQDD